MKKLFYIICMTLLFSCSTKQEDNSIINVSFPAEGVEFVSWFDTFPDVEVIYLTGEGMPVLPVYSNFIVRVYTI